MKYRKKPVIVDAEVYHKGLEDGFGCDSECNYGECEFCSSSVPYISTLKGKHYVSPGDYITTNESGEKSAVSPEEFARDYKLIPPCDYCKYESSSTLNDDICMTCEDFSNFEEVKLNVKT